LKRMRSWTLLTALALAACGGSSASERPAADPAPADTGWVTIDGVEFPAAFADAPPKVVEAYVFAVKHPEVLKYMPCYCGCENETPPHRSNYDCFVDAIHGTRVDPDPMGFG